MPKVVGSLPPVWVIWNESLAFATSLARVHVMRGNQLKGRVSILALFYSNMYTVFMHAHVHLYYMLMGKSFDLSGSIFPQ